jgi:3-deoxy-D-manno-octulosonic-acid transferase
LFLVIYTTAIYCYGFVIYLFSFFNTKAKLFVTGRKNIFERIKNAIPQNEKLVWFHCSSLGEFEQLRPVLELYAEQQKEYKILLTFFSPSGYEIRKNYGLAHYIFYLPLDTKYNAHKFVSMLNIRFAVFSKNDFWFNYFNELHLKKTPLLIMKKMLFQCNKIFVQDQNSYHTLQLKGFMNMQLSADTRLDRVIQITKEEYSNTVIEHFTNTKQVLIAGSTWEKDEEILSQFFNQKYTQVKLIIVPHSIEKHRIESIKNTFKSFKIQQYSNYDFVTSDTQILILDTIGILSKAYRYAHVAYIGGGFGKGIHNTLEPAAYGLPVAFGPRYKKFIEAHEFIKLNVAHSVNDVSQLLKFYNYFQTQENIEIAKNKYETFFRSNSGESVKIVAYLKSLK